MTDDKGWATPRLYKEISIMLMSKLTIISILLAGSTAQHAQTIFAPTDKEVALAGKIRKIHGYGPPGYGEDKKRDARITYWVLELAKPVNVPCTPERPEWASEDCSSAKRLRLFFPLSPKNNGLELKAKALQGRRSIVTGVLHRSDTVGELTPIYLNVVDIHPASSR